MSGPEFASFVAALPERLRAAATRDEAGLAGGLAAAIAAGEAAWPELRPRAASPFPKASSCGRVRIIEPSGSVPFCSWLSGVLMWFMPRAPQTNVDSQLQSFR